MRRSAIVLSTTACSAAGSIGLSPEPAGGASDAGVAPPEHAATRSPTPTRMLAIWRCPRRCHRDRPARVSMAVLRPIAVGVHGTHKVPTPPAVTGSGTVAARGPPQQLSAASVYPPVNGC